MGIGDQTKCSLLVTFVSGLFSLGLKLRGQKQDSLSWFSPSGRFRPCDEWMLGANFRQAGYRIDCLFLVSEFRFRTKIALPIATLGLNLLMNQ